MHKCAGDSFISYSKFVLSTAREISKIINKMDRPVLLKKCRSFSPFIFFLPVFALRSQDKYDLNLCKTQRIMCYTIISSVFQSCFPPQRSFTVLHISPRTFYDTHITVIQCNRFIFSNVQCLRPFIIFTFYAKARVISQGNIRRFNINKF